MLNIIILITILITLIIHRYLTTFWEQKKLPYPMGFLIFANILILLYLINFIWVFGIVIGIVLSVLTFFQVIYSTLLWPFLLPWLISVYTKNDIPKVNMLVYGIWTFIILIVGILTILNFFISDYMSLWKSIINILNLDYFDLVIVIIVIIAVSNIIRSILMKKISKINS